MKDLQMKKRLTSWATWLSVLSLVGLILSHLGVLEKIGLDIGGWQTYVEAFLGALVAFGILNNPTDRENF